MCFHRFPPISKPVEPPRWSILAAFMLLLVGCGDRAISGLGTNPIASAQTVPIQSIQPSPAQTGPVQLKGIVGDQVPLIDGTVYELQDNSGKIWVLTRGQPPTKGQEITIKGTIRYKSISLNGKEQGSVYLEQE